jgi:hypothetical protein
MGCPVKKEQAGGDGSALLTWSCGLSPDVVVR